VRARNAALPQSGRFAPCWRLRASSLGRKLPALGRSVLVAAAALLAPVARSQEAPKAEEIAGYRIYVQKPGPVHVVLSELPGERLGKIDDDRLESMSFSTRSKAVPFVLDGDSRGFVFWGEPDLESHDVRGRSYRLEWGHTGGSASKLSPAVPKGADASATARSWILPEQLRTYHALEALDLASLAERRRPGGYWFYDESLTFTCSNDGSAVLELSGIYIERTHRTPVPGGRFFESVGLHSADAPGTLHVSVGEKDLTVKLGKQGENARLEVPVTAGKNTIRLSAARGGVPLVQSASLSLEERITPGVVYVAPGPVKLPPFGGVAFDLDEGSLLEVKEGLANPKKGDRFVLLDPKGASRPERIECCRKHDRQGKVDWVAIGPRSLLEPMKPLEELRRAQGLKTALVALEDLFDDNSDGTFSADALRDAGKLGKYVLLVGDAARDGRPDDGPWLPTVLVDTYDNGASATDRYFGDRVGRFPCRTKEEVAAMVAKTIAYEKCDPGTWQRELSFVCGEGRFGPLVDGLIEQLFTQAVGKRVPASFDIDVTYANPQSVYFYPPDDFSKRVVDRLSAGPFVFDYVGHGAPETLDTVHWGKKRFPILTAKDAWKVDCKDGHYPIALLTACWTGAFDQPERTVGEALALNPHGAVAVLAASRVSHPFANALLSLELTERLFKQGDERLGDRFKEALDHLSLTSGGAEGKLVVQFGKGQLDEEGLAERLLEDERHLYNLLGDPALVVRLPRPISVEAPDEAPAGTKVVVKAGGKSLLAVTLEKPRSVRTDLQGLDPAQGPEVMKDPAVAKRVRETNAQANDLVVVRGSVDGARGVLDLPRDLEPGEHYLVKVVTASGEAGSIRLAVTRPSPHKKKYY
jgi:hypothetical protein